MNRTRCFAVMSIPTASKPSRTVNLKSLLRMTDEEARAFLERVRWPNGPVCPHCGVVNEATKLAPKPRENGKGTSARSGVYKCRPCRKQFSVTVKTVFESSHVPLSTWLAAFFLLCSAKKSMSALQLQRQLGIGSYKTAWFLAHRVRFAMANGPLGELLKGAIEADETYVGGKPRPAAWRGKGWFAANQPRRKRGRGTHKTPVACLIERGGGARAKVVPDASGPTLYKFIVENVDTSSSRLLSDEWRGYKTIGKEFAGGHEAVRHARREYARPGGIHSNTAESFFSLFKRGFHGSFHHLSPKHMQAYLDEFSFRWSHKDELDETRTLRALGQSAGVRLMYHAPREEGDAPRSLVAGR